MMGMGREVSVPRGEGESGDDMMETVKLGYDSEIHAVVRLLDRVLPLFSARAKTRMLQRQDAQLDIHLLGFKRCRPHSHQRESISQHSLCLSFARLLVVSGHLLMLS